MYSFSYFISVSIPHYLDYFHFVVSFEIEKYESSNLVFLFQDYSNCSLCVCAHFYPTLCDFMDCGPPGSPVHRISSGKNTEVGCHFLLYGIFLTETAPTSPALQVNLNVAQRGKLKNLLQFCHMDFRINLSTCTKKSAATLIAITQYL